MALQATTVRTVHEQACPDIGPICATEDVEPLLHDQRFVIGQLRLLAGYAFDPRWSVEAQLRGRVVDSGIVYRTLEGEAFSPPFADVHHRDETLGGLEDAWLNGRWSGYLGPLALGLRAGISVPLGRTEPDPFVAGRLGQTHQHVQFGTGTWDPLVGVDVAWRRDALSIFGYGFGLTSLYANGHGYRAGSRIAVGALGRHELWSWLAAQLTVDFAHESAERWQGRLESEGNLGRSDLLLGLGALWTARLATLALTIKVPVWTRIVAQGGHVEMPAMVDLAVMPR